VLQLLSLRQIVKQNFKMLSVIETLVIFGIDAIATLPFGADVYIATPKFQPQRQLQVGLWGNGVHVPRLVEVECKPVIFNAL